MKVIVVPDVHSRTFWKDVVNVKCDKIIFLGDYVDPYPSEDPETLYDNPVDCLEEIIQFKRDNFEKVELLYGNHILHYVLNGFPESSRYNRISSGLYERIIKENQNLFTIGYVIDNVIFTHAGITKEWAKLLNKSVLEVGKFLQQSIDFDKDFVNYGYLAAVSYYRGGWDSCGSCEWADIREHINHHETEVKGEIVPIGEEGIYQVFGHTQLNNPLITDKWACLDCRKIFEIDTITHEITECSV